MKLNEYIRLGKISINSRKKSTRNTVRGIAFGLILLIPIIFFTLSFYVDLLNTVNGLKSVSSFTVSVNPDKESAGSGTVFSYGQDDFSSLKALQESTVDEIIYSEIYGMSSYSLTIGNVNKAKADLETGSAYGQDAPLNGKIKIIDTQENNGKLVPNGYEFDLAKMNTPLICAGTGFTDGKSGEAIISEALAAQFGLEPEEAIGKTISAAAFGKYGSANNFIYRYFEDNDNNPNNVYFVENATGGNMGVNVLENFTITGVVTKNYYTLSYVTRFDAHIWISGNSAYTGEGNARKTEFLPTLTRMYHTPATGSPIPYIVVTYPKAVASIAEDAAKANKFFPAFPAVHFTAERLTGNENAFLYERPIKTATLQCDGYGDAVSVANAIDGLYKSVAGDAHAGEEDYSYAERICAPHTFSRIRPLYMVGNYVTIVAYTFGGIIFFATLLNLYNSVNYSVQIRRNYMGMMRAIGAKKNVIPHLYLVEILLIFARSLPWVLVGSCGISLGLKFGVDAIFNREVGTGVTIAELLGTKISLNFGFFFVSLTAAFTFIILIALIFSRVSCRTITNNGVIQVLSDEK